MDSLSDEQYRDGIQRICDLASDTARVSGLQLDAVQVDNGQKLLTGSEYHLLQMAAGGKTVTVKIHHEEVAAASGLTEEKVLSAVRRLQLMLER